MTHLEELRQQEKKILNSIWRISHGPEVFNGAKRQMFAEQLRAVRTELALYEVNLVEQAKPKTQHTLRGTSTMSTTTDTEGYIIILEAIIAGTINRGFDPDDAAWAERELAKLSGQK